MSFFSKIQHTLKWSTLLLGVVIFSTTPTWAKDKSQNLTVKEVPNRGEIDKIKCTATKDGKMRFGENQTLYVTFSAKDAKVKVSEVNYWFHSDIDYNGNEGLIAFNPTKDFLDSEGVIENGSMELLRSTDYVIRVAPEHRSQDNIIVKYEILFNELIPGKGMSPEQNSYVQCARYAVTRCGDKIVDKEFDEECDDGLNGSAMCTKECKKIKK